MAAACAARVPNDESCEAGNGEWRRERRFGWPAKRNKQKMLSVFVHCSNRQLSCRLSSGNTSTFVSKKEKRMEKSFMMLILVALVIMVAATATVGGGDSANGTLALAGHREKKSEKMRLH